MRTSLWDLPEKESAFDHSRKAVIRVPAGSGGVFLLAGTQLSGRNAPMLITSFATGYVAVSLILTEFE